MPPIGFAKIKDVAFEPTGGGSTVFWDMQIGMIDGQHQLGGQYNLAANPSQTNIDSGLRSSVMSAIQASDLNGIVPQNRILFQTGTLG